MNAAAHIPDMSNQTRVSAGVPAGGQFAAHSRAESDVVLDVEPRPIDAGSLSIGDLVTTDTNTDHSPLSFQLMRSRELRRIFREAGMPREIRVIDLARDTEEPSDIVVTFDVGGREAQFSFHREQTLTARTAFR